jgi:hypothetical protein
LSFFSSPAKAETFRTESAGDFYFQLESGNTFTVRATAQQYGIDSMFWLYDSNNVLLVANDDHFGLDSYISYNVQQSGTYRLRTGVCCGDPNRWYGSFYDIETDSVPTGVPSTTTSSTTTTSTTTTTIAPYLNAPQNLIVTSTNQDKVYLSWDVPEQSSAQVERYAVFFSKDNWSSGWAVSSTQTSAVVEGLEPNTEYQFKVRADNDSIPVYSGWSNEVSGLTLQIPTTTTSTTSTTSTTTSSTTTIPPTTTSVFVFPTIAPTTLPIATTTTVTTLSPTTTAVTTTTIPVTTTIPPTTTTTIPPVAIAQEVLEIVGLNQELSNEQVAEVINILESDSISQEEVANVVDKILESNLSSDQATDLATSSKVLESISPEQAGKIFAEISVSDLSVEQEAALVETLTNAPDDIKKSFETEIDIFGEGLDDYVPTGSNLDVGTRRTFLAATTVLSASITLAGGTGGSPAPSSGGSGGSNGGNTPNTPSSKKEEDMDAEEEDEPVEIEGPEGGDDEGVYTKNSIFKYEEGTMKKFSPWGFIKKFSRETAAMAFTISGSVIVFATLSGDTRRITLIATGCAFLIHYVNVMLKNDE